MGISLSQCRCAISSYRTHSRFCDSRKCFTSTSNIYRFVHIYNIIDNNANIYLNCEIDNKVKNHDPNTSIILYFIIILYAYIFIELTAVSMSYSYHSPRIFVSQFFKPPLKINCLVVNLTHINSIFILTLLRLITSYFYRGKYNVFRRYLKCGLNSISEFCSVSIVIYLYTINLILVVCSNMSLLNPGPVYKKGLSVYYQNIQGLIPFTHTNSESPPLNLTKLAELHTYVAYKKPDIVILNETWLKENIGSKEIFPFPNYKIFRLDRSPYSHPPDKNDKRKFKSNGRGVLIAINTDVVTNPKIVKSNSHAEVLSISLDIAWGKKLCFTTCYRVGTLGQYNLNGISKYVNMISNTKTFKSHTSGGFQS